VEKTSVDHNCVASPAGQAVMSYTDAQALLLDLIGKGAEGTVCYSWKLVGDDVNSSLCKLLDMPWSNFRLMLWKCGILCGPADSFKTAEFEKLIIQIG